MHILLSIFVFYAIGIISYEYNFFYYSLLIIFVMLIYNTIKTKKLIYNIVIISFLILSFINCNYNSKSALTQCIDEEIDVIAKIKSINKTSNENSNYNSFNATVLKINGKDLKSKENTIIYLKKTQKLGINTIVNIKGNVSDVGYGKNYLLFNYKKYLRSKKIFTTIFCKYEPIIIENNYSIFNELTNNFKIYTENIFTNKLYNKNAEIILSIILGDVEYLDDGFYDNIRNMGLAHIFAVSGLHIGLLYTTLLKFFKLIGFNRRISWIVTWSLLWLYGFLIGFPLSILRTLVMFTLLFASEVLYRRYNSLNAIALSALILTIFNPFWIFDAGFLLSFSAALSLILFNKYIIKNIKTENKILRMVYMYLFLQLFTLPVVTYYFNYLPIMGIMYNLLLIPIFTVVLIASFVFLILYKAFWYILIIPFKLFDYMLYSLRYIINFTENFAFNGIVIPTFSICEIIVIYIFIFYLIYLYNYESKTIKKLGFSIIICFYFITYIIIPVTDTSLYFNLIDVGQGMFSTMKYKNYYFIFDCGSTSNKNLGEYTAVPYLIKRGINMVDGVFISHWDSDHYSGICDIIDSDNISIRNIFAPTNNEDINFDIKILKKGDYIKLGNIFKIKILWPDESIEKNNKNNTSLVILINYDGRNILLPGDIEADVEFEIIKDLVATDILIVPHHGSKSSSSENFVKVVSSKLAAMSYGKNSYGIPSEKVITRYKEVNSDILSTFTHGEINFIIKNNNLYYNAYMNLKSNNYYKLYFVWIIPKLFMFGLLLSWVIISRDIYKKRLNYEL